MHQYRIAVCDDNYYNRNELLSFLSDFENETDNTFEIYSYSTGSALLSDIDKMFHIILLDIEMDTISGIEVAKMIRTSDDTVQIIFATGHDSYAFHAYQVEAIGYLLKPLSYELLKKLLNKAIITIEYICNNLSSQTKYIEFKIKNDTTRVDTKHIIYIEKRRNNILIHTSVTTYTIYDTLSSIHKRLDINKFIYIHQGYIVNYNKILEINDNFIVLEGLIKLPVSRKYYKPTKERFFSDIYNQ